MRVLTAAAVIATIVSISVAPRAEPFPIDRCAAPPANAGKAGDVDKQCGLSGKAPEAEHQAQNQAKNNLCAAAGQPVPAAGRLVPLTKQDFMRLQQAADRLVAQGRLEYGERNRLPKDRRVLKDLVTVANGAKVGEGSFVSYVGFISHPRNSNVEKGESGNCET